MAWIMLLLAGTFEMFGVAMINKFHHDKNIFSVILLGIGFAGSFLFLSMAMKTLPMGTAYAIWTGIGASGGALLGMVLYGEPKDWKRIVFITMIITAAVGLKIIA